MNTIADNFELIFGTSDNIQALRNKVLDLAIRGKLVEQMSEDEPASKLLSRIEYESTQNRRSVNSIKSEDYPFEIPENWAWTNLSKITEYIQRGKSPKYSETKLYPVIAQKCVQWTGVSLEKALYVSPESIGSYSAERFLIHGDILWNSTGTGSCGRVGLFKDSIRNGFDKIVADSHVTVVRCFKKFINFEYIFLWLKSPEVQSVIESKASGSTNQIELSTDTIKNYLVSIPPLVEQHRIVARVNFLMSEIDKLEAALKKKEQFHELLPKAVVDAISKCQSDDELKQKLEFMIDNYEHIFQTPESMQELRNVILQLAIEGKLVPQNPDDEPASALLDRIRIEKANSKMPFEVVKENEYPFAIPSNWEWTQLSNISQYIQRGKSPKYSDIKRYPVIAQKCVQWSGVSLEKALYITPESFENYSKERLLLDGDLLWNSTGTGSCGRVGLFKDSIRNGYEEIVADSHVTVVRCMKKYISPEYLFIWLKSPEVQNVIESKASGSTNQIELATETIRRYLISVPPTEEQYRIVAKVDSLLALINQLEEQLKHRKKLVNNLASA